MYLLDIIGRYMQKNKIGFFNSDDTGNIFIDKFPPNTKKGILLSEKVNTSNELWSNYKTSDVKDRMVQIYIYGSSNEVKLTRIKAFQVYDLFTKITRINVHVTTIQASEPIFIGENVNRQIIYLVELNLQKIKE